MACPMFEPFYDDYKVDRCYEDCILNIYQLFQQCISDCSCSSRCAFEIRTSINNTEVVEEEVDVTMCEVITMAVASGYR